MRLRTKILSYIHRRFPFPLNGDAEISGGSPSCEISCIINFWGRLNLLEGILYSLAEQDLPEKQVEVILVEDRGGTEEGRSAAKRFSSMLNVRYFALTEKFGVMGHSRNVGLSKATGRYILLLDDDTVILQKDFLAVMVKEFEQTSADAIVPRGSASFYLLKGRYGFHEPHFPTSRCMAYRAVALRDMGGFVSSIVGQEDVEFVIRYLTSGRLFYNSERLHYLHPPLIVNSLKKPAAVGRSFALLRKRYPFAVWVMLLLNGARHAPLLLIPGSMKRRMQGRFGCGFLLGIYYALSGKTADYW